MNFDLARGLKALPFFSRKERKVRKEMEDGWRAGVRRAARKNLTRRRGGAEEVRKVMKGGNGATNGSVVTLRRATGVNPWA